MCSINLSINLTTPYLHVDNVYMYLVLLPLNHSFHLSPLLASCRRDISFLPFFFTKQIPPASAPVSGRLISHQAAEPSIWTQSKRSLLLAKPNFIYRRSASFLDIFGAALLPLQFYYIWQKTTTFTADVYVFVLMTPLAAFCSLGNSQRGAIEILARNQMNR